MYLADALVGNCHQVTFPDGRILIRIVHDWFSENECIETKQTIAEHYDFLEESTDSAGHHWAIVKLKERQHGTTE